MLSQLADRMVRTCSVLLCVQLVHGIVQRPQTRYWPVCIVCTESWRIFLLGAKGFKNRFLKSTASGSLWFRKGSQINSQRFGDKWDYVPVSSFSLSLSCPLFLGSPLLQTHSHSGCAEMAMCVLSALTLRRWLLSSVLCALPLPFSPPPATIPIIFTISSVCSLFPSKRGLGPELPHSSPSFQIQPTMYLKHS